MSPTYTLIWSPESLDDLRDIRDYIGLTLREPGIAKRQVARIRDAAQRLKSMPERHAILDWEPWRSRGVRKMAVGNYVILYMADNDARTVSVVRVVHGSRDFERIARGE